MSFIEEREQLDAAYAVLPPEFQRRIDGFRRRRPGWEHEPYEMSVCTDAVKVARALGSADAVRHFSGLSWQEQNHLVPDLSDGHSGNSFGMVCRLAFRMLNNPDLVEKEHGALCGLVGCDEYGCWAIEAPEGRVP